MLGALKLLADSYTSHELNDKAWALYTQFRPEVNEWGKRSEIRCSRILDLRKVLPNTPAVTQENPVPKISYVSSTWTQEDDEPQSKKVKVDEVVT